MYGTFWALLPPIIAIVLALITKEAYSSLFIAIPLYYMIREKNHTKKVSSAS